MLAALLYYTLISFQVVLALACQCQPILAHKVAVPPAQGSTVRFLRALAKFQGVTHHFVRWAVHLCVLSAAAAAAAAASAMLRHSMLRAGARPLVSSLSRQQLPIISHLYKQSSKTQSVAASCLPVAPYGSAHRIVPYGKLNSQLLPLAAQADLSIRSFSTRRRPPPRQEPPEEDPSTARDKIMKRLGSLGALGYLLLAKTKYVLVALKLTKAAPLRTQAIQLRLVYVMFNAGPATASVLLSTSLISICAESLWYQDESYAIVMRSMPDCVEHEAMVAIAGPIAGGATAFAIATYGQMFDSQLAFALADFAAATAAGSSISVATACILYAAVIERAVHYAIPLHQMSKFMHPLLTSGASALTLWYMINLFNLLPIGDLDGGRIAKAINPLVNVAGLGIGGYMIYEGFIDPSYYEIPLHKKAGITAGYVALIAALLLAMRENNKRRKTPRQLQAEKEGYFLADNHTPGEPQYDDFFEDTAHNDPWSKSSGF
eukprot:15588-Heterococcus_DN1.PRE.2